MHKKKSSSKNDRNRQLAEENNHLKKNLEMIVSQQNKIVQKALQVEYYTYIEFEKIISTVEKDIELMQNIVNNLHKIKEDLQEEHHRMMDRIKGNNIFNISFINIRK